MRVGQVTGNPFPLSHSCKIFRVIFSAFPLQSLFNDVHSTARLVIEKKDTELVIVSTDFLRYFEMK